MFGYEVLFDGEHCVVCGATVEVSCEHILTDEEFVDEFADGQPYTLANLVREIATEDERALVEAAPATVRSMVDAAAPDEDGEPNLLYWTTHPGVVAAFFAGDRPGGSGVGYWHADGQAFEAALRDDTQQAIAWLDAHLPHLRDQMETTQAAEQAELAAYEAELRERYPGHRQGT